ncbi:hypothetical protein CcCBS67573_g04347 [Chytriomyces confervae]|uniref:T6SS Phospholipase effector Tle1-like catalytic domain-containing protein n=1 Tax=Chytriomyces confervae TaxID=246404 RepID=A0A507FFN9_9FUNG|nr:hypothetical protein CcCBS67573_g04347 [Chytriomyces confervae]
MPAPVENIAYMDAVELKPTTQQLKAGAAATMKETASVESSKKTTTTKPQILDSQANYFANNTTSISIIKTGALKNYAVPTVNSSDVHRIFTDFNNYDVRVKFINFRAKSNRFSPPNRKMGSKTFLAYVTIALLGYILAANAFWGIGVGGKEREIPKLTVEPFDPVLDAHKIAQSDAFDAPIGGGRRLIVCFDGSWNSPGSLSDTHSLGGVKLTASLVPSNVVKLAYLLGSGKNQFDPTADPVHTEFQKVYYHSGVATEIKDQKKAELEGNFGNIHDHVLDAYAWLAREYKAGDEISAFGFSRGSTIVRSLFSFIRFAGLVDLSKFPNHADVVSKVLTAYELYKTRKIDESDYSDRALEFKYKYCHANVALKMIGVMDTVEALDVPDNYSKVVPSWVLTELIEATGAIEENDYHDLNIGYDVEHAYHAISIDEAREYFPVTMFERYDPARMPATHVREQKWFRGGHGDVGGGWWESGLSDIVLDWMIEKARAAGLVVRDRSEFDAHLSPLLLGISKEDYESKSAVVNHDFFEWIGSTDGESPQGRKIPRDLKGRYMDPSKYAPSELHESVYRLFKDSPLPENLKAVLEKEP